MSDRLTDADKIAIGRKLQGNDMKLLALIYLGINEVEIESTWQEEEGRALHFNKEILRKWHNKDSKNDKKVNYCG